MNWTTGRRPIMTRHANLATPAARSKLKIRAAPHYASPFGAGLSLGYRRMKGAGSWILRRYLGGEKYVAEAFAVADDLGPAPGSLSYHDALTRARGLAKAHAEHEKLKADGPPLTVAKAIEDYVEAREARWTQYGGPRRDARNRLARHVLADAALAETPLALLTVDQLQEWRRDAGERLVHDFRASLNAAARRYRDKLPPALRDIVRDGLANPGGAHEGARKIVALSDADVRRLVSAALQIDEEGQWDGALARLTLVLAAVGSRFSQIARCRVVGVQAQERRILVPTSRKGRNDNKPSHTAVPIGDDVLKALAPATAGRLGPEPLFMRPGWRFVAVGKWERSELRPWRNADEFGRPWRLIAERAGLPAAVPYDLRHAAIIRALRLGLPVQLVARLFDTSALMIQRSYSASIVDALGELSERMAVPLAPVSPSPIAVVR
jgi:integrase